MIDTQKNKNSKTNASLISIVQRVADITSLFLCGYIVSNFFDFHFYYRPLIFSFFLLSVFQLLGGITDFYRSWRGVKFSTELQLAFYNWMVTISLCAIITHIVTGFQFGFYYYFLWFISFCVVDFLFRIGIRLVAGYFRSLGYNKRIVAIVGDSPAGEDLINIFNEQAWLGFDVYGKYTDDKNVINRKGDLKKLVIDAREGKVDRIYMAFHMWESDVMDGIVKELADTTCSVMLIPDIFTYNILHCRIEDVNGIPIVPLFETHMNGINKIIKRLEDIIFSFIILAIISPLLVLISCAVKISSAGPVFFKQKRYGVDGKPIKVWKFRTMVVMEDDEIVTQATKNDPRVTRVGRFLRQSSLDELPQFFNVFFGSMSIVGPRPHAISHNEQYRLLIKGYMLRHKVKPGITGWAQVNGWRGETDTLEKMKKRIEYDLQYIKHWSLFMDLKIILLTIFKGFFNKSAY